MTMGAAGIRQSLLKISGPDLSIVGGVGRLSMSKKDDGQRAIEGLNAGVSQVRVGAEITRITSSMSPHSLLSGRYDGGGSQSGGGLEVVGGLRYVSDKISFEARVTGWPSTRPRIIGTSAEWHTYSTSHDRTVRGLM